MRADDWIDLLKATWQHLVTQRSAPAPQLWASLCLRHANCIWVAAGNQIEHVQWQQTDPAKAAQDLFAQLFPTP